MQAFSIKHLSVLFVGFLLTSYALSDSTAEKSLHVHHQVEITGFEFVPKNLAVAPGDIVTWTNKDIVPHNVINTADKRVISPDLATGENFSYKVSAGAVEYFCGFHPSMTGSLKQ